VPKHSRNQLGLGRIKVPSAVGERPQSTATLAVEFEVLVREVPIRSRRSVGSERSRRKFKNAPKLHVIRNHALRGVRKRDRSPG
jgi:hypothetical protein